MRECLGWCSPDHGSSSAFTCRKYGISPLIAGSGRSEIGIHHNEAILNELGQVNCLLAVGNRIGEVVGDSGSRCSACR